MSVVSSTPEIINALMPNPGCKKNWLLWSISMNPCRVTHLMGVQSVEFQS